MFFLLIFGPIFKHNFKNQEVRIDLCLECFCILDQREYQIESRIFVLSLMVSFVAAAHFTYAVGVNVPNVCSNVHKHCKMKIKWSGGVGPSKTD
jgi:hypothetical protein